MHTPGLGNLMLFAWQNSWTLISVLKESQLSYKPGLL